MKQILSLLGLLLSATVYSQGIDSYTVSVQPVEIPGLPGIQSAAVGYHNDEVLLVGGRLDGLHRRQPNVSFDSAGHNDQLFVVNLVTKQIWSQAVADLTPVLRDQLKATNYCYTQVQDTLVIAGGYGISEAANEHITFRSALKFSVSGVIDAIKAGTLHASNFVRVEDSLFAETGGQLEFLNGIYYLVGGHLFDGRYNPRNGPSFTQTYSSEVRMFKWNGNQVVWLKTIHNEDLLHKRDYNLVRIEDATTPFYAFSGVFQKDRDLPFQTATRLDLSGTPTEVPAFRQFYNHYECPELVIFDPKTGTNHVIFLGGIAQYYDSLGVLAQDNNVPFVETISRVSIDANGNLNEYLLPSKMPVRYGAGVSFVPSKSKQWNRKIFTWIEPNADTLNMGYLLGGISTVTRNVFWIHEGQESSALNVVYRLMLVKTNEPQKALKHSKNPIALQIYEDPKALRLFLQFELPQADKVQLQIYDKKGKLLIDKTKSFKLGKVSWKKFPKYVGWYRCVLTFESHPEWNWEQWMYYD